LASGVRNFSGISTVEDIAHGGARHPCLSRNISTCRPTSRRIPHVAQPVCTAPCGRDNDLTVCLVDGQARDRSARLTKENR
jgi:hypothetical protein